MTSINISARYLSLGQVVCRYNGEQIIGTCFVSINASSVEVNEERAEENRLKHNPANNTNDFIQSGVADV